MSEELIFVLKVFGITLAVIVLAFLANVVWHAEAEREKQTRWTDKQ